MDEQINEAIQNVSFTVKNICTYIRNAKPKDPLPLFFIEPRAQ